ncbi:hypothetical protein B296_00057341 [Ensete ventricosum]|uniref:Uncharacterized protein n=1 Tax=Ensete ventricosum TaxID=4639 RepID=A0A426XFQ9_ENSVE|nr:hypothetical protein B296_00057341 [Ensete ventricosum]
MLLLRNVSRAAPARGHARMPHRGGVPDVAPLMIKLVPRPRCYRAPHSMVVFVQVGFPCARWIVLIERVLLGIGGLSWSRYSTQAQTDLAWREDQLGHRWTDLAKRVNSCISRLCGAVRRTGPHDRRGTSQCQTLHLAHVNY